MHYRYTERNSVLMQVSTNGTFTNLQPVTQILNITNAVPACTGFVGRSYELQTENTAVLLCMAYTFLSSHCFHRRIYTHTTIRIAMFISFGLVLQGNLYNRIERGL